MQNNGGPWATICSLKVNDAAVACIINKRAAMEVGNASRTQFWYDAWGRGGIFKEKFPGLFSIST